jgi:PE family
VAAAGTDEVSAAVAAVFAEHGLSFQALSAQAATFHEQFVRALSGGAQAYAANANPLQELLDLINAPSRLLFQRPLIGDGRNGTSPGQGR